MSKKLLQKFYAAFNDQDSKTMNDCYCQNAEFYDPVFENLNHDQTTAMWSMLCARAQDFSVELVLVNADDQQGSAEWFAKYTFSQTGRTVTNHVKSKFQFQKGKILKQNDQFDFYKWSRMALGPAGILLGWTPIIKNKVRNKSAEALAEYMAKNK